MSKQQLHYTFKKALVLCKSFTYTTAYNLQYVDYSIQQKQYSSDGYNFYITEYIDRQQTHTQAYIEVKHQLFGYGIVFGQELTCTEAVLALQNWGCNAPKPLWSSRLVIPIKSPHETFKRENFIRHISYCASKILFLILIAFRATQRSSVIFMVTIFVASCQTGGAKPKTRVHLHPLLQRRTATVYIVCRGPRQYTCP